MMIRAFAFLALAAGLVVWLEREQAAGRFRAVDEGWLDLLVSNAREHFVPAASAENSAIVPSVVFARIDEAEREDYSAWPPAPIDLLLMLKRLTAHQPASLTLVTPLDWGSAAPQFMPELAEALLPFSPVIGAVEVTTGEASIAEGLVLQRLPALEQVIDPSQALPAAASVVSAPASELATKLELGLHHSAGETASALPLAYRVGPRVLPSVLLQMLAAATRTPFASQRLSTGLGAALYLGEDRYLPLDEHAALVASPATASFASMSASDLMTPAIAADEVASSASPLRKGQHIILGSAKAEPLARALAQALATPKLSLLPATVRWAVVGAVALLGLWLLRQPRAKVFSRCLLLLLAVFLVGYLSFQASLVWMPPVLPTAVLLFAGLFARVFGRASPASPGSSTPASPGLTLSKA